MKLITVSPELQEQLKAVQAKIEAQGFDENGNPTDNAYAEALEAEKEAILVQIFKKPEVTTNAVSLHGELCILGVTEVISIGFNNACKQVITKSLLFHDDGTYYCKNGGISIKVDGLDEFYVNTPANRALLKAIINA